MKKILELPILKNQLLSQGVFLLEVEKTKYVGDVEAGQFFNLQCGESIYPLLRRPISVSLVTEKTLEFIVFIKGEGTQLLSYLEKGKTLNLIGPLGNTYTLPEKGGKHLVLAGGIGVAPQRELVKRLAERNAEKITAQIGFRSTPYALETYKEYCNTVEIATEDGCSGVKGYVTKLLDEALEKEKWDMVYVCGPHGMIKAVADRCNATQTPVQLLMEERMACGIGACLVCACKVKSDTKEGYENVRTCKEGPVFFGTEVMFDE